ncbi:unnamed protein product, partial [Choristocarpus tenellus]
MAAKACGVKKAMYAKRQERSGSGPCQRQGQRFELASESAFQQKKTSQDQPEVVNAPLIAEDRSGTMPTKQPHEIGALTSFTKRKSHRSQLHHQKDLVLLQLLKEATWLE